MSKFYLVDTSYNIFTGFEVVNNQKMYCYQDDSDFRNAKFFRSIDAIISYFKKSNMPLYPGQHKVLEYTPEENIIYHDI